MPTKAAVMRPQQRSPPSWGRGTSASIPSTRLVITLTSPGGRLSPKRFPQTNGGPQPARSHRPASRYCSRDSFPGLRRRRAMPCEVFVPGRTADPGRVQRRGLSFTEDRYGQSSIGDRRSGLAETRAMARGFGSGIDPLRRGNYREAHSLEWVRPLLATIAPDELELSRALDRSG